jgi:hypothetical protein
MKYIDRNEAKDLGVDFVDDDDKVIIQLLLSKKALRGIDTTKESDYSADVIFFQPIGKCLWKLETGTRAGVTDEVWNSQGFTDFVELDRAGEIKLSDIGFAVDG